jgi:RHS repeat-associated protein
VKVKHHMALQWTPAVARCERGQPVRWEARDVPVSVTLPASFDVQAHTPDGQTVSDTVPYTKINGSPGSIAYTYDANGNRTEKWTNSLFAARYFYGSDNQLLGISFNNDQDYTDAGDYAYSYDPFGRRISATEDGVTRYFAYDGLDSMTELDASANVTKWYLRGSGLGGGIADIIAEITPITTNYFCYNHRGDVVGLTTHNSTLTTRYEYTAFGQPLANIQDETTNVRQPRFSSKEYDTRSGLSYYGFRYYDADSGRWMTKDPGFIVDAMGLYNFCMANPINDADFYGLMQIELKPCMVYVFSGHGSTIGSYVDEWNSESAYPDMTRVGVISCKSALVQGKIPKQFAVQSTKLPKTTALIGPKAPNNGLGPGKANYVALLKAALEAGKEDAKKMAEDCRCECPNIGLYLWCQTPEQKGANFTVKQEAYENKCNKLVVVYRCKKNKGASR